MGEAGEERMRAVLDSEAQEPPGWRYLGNDRDNVLVGRRYLVQVGCDSENWFEAEFVGLVETARGRWLQWDNGVWVEEGGCGTAIYEAVEEA